MQDITEKRILAILSKSKTPKRPLDDAENPATKILGAKRRKEHKKTLEAKKVVEIAAIEETSEAIFTMQETSRPSFYSLKKQVDALQNDHQEALKKITEMESTISHLTAQLHAEHSAIESNNFVISDLQQEVAHLKTENEQLKREVLEYQQKYSDVSTGGFPPASAEDLKFLNSLVQFYSSHKPPLINQEIATVEIDASDVHSDTTYPENLLVNHYTPPTKPQERILTNSVGLETVTSGTYSYTITPEDIQLEQEAFKPGEGKRELVKGFGVYIHFVDLEQSEQSCKNSATGLMRNLISLWYSNFRLAACSATSGINSSIRTAIFKYCEIKFSGQITSDKLKRDLTSKCGEERRKILKKTQVPSLLLEYP